MKWKKSKKHVIIPSREFDDSGALCLRGVDATENSEDSTHGCLTRTNERENMERSSTVRMQRFLWRDVLVAFFKKVETPVFAAVGFQGLLEYDIR